jgi:hypothetical protein
VSAPAETAAQEKPTKPSARLVPSFAADGRRTRSYTLGACERLFSLDKVTAKRNARGEIRAIHFRDQDGGSALRAVATMGQRYSEFVQVGDVNLWQLKDLDGAPGDYARVVVEACR